MFTINNQPTHTYEVNKSVFITYMYHVESIKEANKILDDLRNQYPDATHHVSAYLIGNSGQFGKMNDDGEPSGTSGSPVFDVLRKNNLTNTMCVVIRYFGGIKLGAGGLVRAYSKAASECLKLANIVPIIEYSLIKLEFGYSYLTQIEKLLTNYEIINREFTSNITLTIKIPTSDISLLEALIKQISYSQIILSILPKNEE